MESLQLFLKEPVKTQMKALQKELLITVVVHMAIKKNKSNWKTEITCDYYINILISIILEI